MFGFAVAAMAPALLISRMISPRKRSNPVKFLPMECGQVPSGEGRTHFMMQYYPYILMFVVFDVMAIFLYAWGIKALAWLTGVERNDVKVGMRVKLVARVTSDGKPVYKFVSV